MKTADFDYELPEALIAQEPPPERGQSRMMVLYRDSGRLEHDSVASLPDRLAAGDLVVVNDTRVIPARIFGERADSGGRVELLLCEPAASEAGECEVWDCLYRASRPARPGIRLNLASGRLNAEVVAGINERGMVRVRLEGKEPLAEILEAEGTTPLPPYIKREPRHGDRISPDRARYQTVYARHAGAVAAPTAGLHFSSTLLADLEERGIERANVTLHVGPGTFRPVKSDRVCDHSMDSERFVVPAATQDAVRRARARGKRVVAVGTTTVRTLESAAAEDGIPRAGEGRTSLFIYPPYRFRVVDAILTNFHLPRSTLIMMISAFAGREQVLKAYAEAVRQRYRFYSYGDCMLIL